MSGAMLYRPSSATEVAEFVKDARSVVRRAEKAMKRPGGSLLDIGFARMKIGELAVAAKGIVAPEGGRIHVTTVRVNYDLPWSGAANDAGANTEDDQEIHKVGHLYVPKHRGIVTHRLVFVNFGKRTTSESNLTWGRKFKIPPADPQSIFAFAAENPRFHKSLGVSVATVVSLMPCSFGGGQRMPLVRSRGTGRGVNLEWFAIERNDHCWSAFVC